MDSFHKDEINFGHEEAVRMHANHPDWKHEADKWLRTTTGQEFCDELVYGTIDHHTLDALLRSFGANINRTNRNKFLALAQKLMTSGEA